MRTSAVPIALLALLLAPTAARADTHVDEDVGYSIQVPQGWREIPIAAEERYIVAKWQTEKEYVDRKEGASMRPELKVVLFDRDAKRVTVEKKDGVTIVETHNPYKTYKDWVKSDEVGGRFLSKEEEILVGGVPVTWFEVAYQKLTVARHGLAYVYHADDVDYCATVEVLEQDWEKLAPSLFTCLKSFKIFPRKGNLFREESRHDEVGRDPSMATPEERWKARTETFERNVKAATARLPDGWYVKRSKNYVALSHADEKYTAVILDQAEAVRDWADSHLAFFGVGLPGPELLRICKDSDEESSFRDLSARSGGWVHEIVLSRNEGFWGFGAVADQIFNRWLRDKSPRLYYALPPWLERGITEWIHSAYPRGGKLMFRTDVGLYIALKLAVRTKRLISPRDILQMSSRDLMKKDDEPAPGGNDFLASRTTAWQQSSGFVRYLLEGPGKTNARTKDLLRTYLSNLEAYIKEQDEKPIEAGQSLPAAKTEEEEEQQYKNRKQFWEDNDHEKELMKALFERTFKDWTDADWSAVEKSYRAFAA